jgi:hypothetical protein
MLIEELISKYEMRNQVIDRLTDEFDHQLRLAKKEIPNNVNTIHKANNMKTVEEIKSDILVSLGQSCNPIGVLLDEYLRKVVTDIVRDKLIDFQCYLNDEGLITSHDWTFDDKANEYLGTDPVE